MALVAIAGAAVTYDQRPVVSRKYSVGIDLENKIGFTPASKCAPTDHVDEFSFAPTVGYYLHASMCFPTFTAGGKGPFVIFIKNHNGEVLGNEPYSPEVRAFKSRAEAEFKLLGFNDSELDRAGSAAKWLQWREGGMYTLLAVFGVWIAGCLVGWIVRGFLGIPRGKDSRVE